nr:PLP-dependent aminotransferase family protein [uncultured Rhodopila sp.]
MLIPLKLLRDRPLQQQLYEQLRALIISSRLASGTRMPSTRMLAEQFSVSRITVLLTYERLIAEGYLRTIPAKGTFVHRVLAADGCVPRANDNATAEPDPGTVRLPGRPDPHLFPAVKWRALIRTALNTLCADTGEEPVIAELGLRRAISRWLSTSRGLAVEADQIILAHGRQHALHIAAHLLLRPGSRAVTEAPGDPAAELMFAGSGANLVTVPVDEDGIQTERLPAGGAALVLVTPEHQRPLGSVLSLKRRHALLSWAARAGATVIEEDSDGELRYEEMDAPALMTLDRDGIVLHAGDFAAALGPGVMLGYLAVPQRLIGPARAASRLAGAFAGRLEAEALATLIDSGSYARHLHAVRKAYLLRRDALIRSLRRHFGETARISGAAAGLHLVWTLPPQLRSAAAVAAMARRLGLDAGRVGERAVLLGFGVPAVQQIETAVERLAQALGGAGDGKAFSGD